MTTHSSHVAGARPSMLLALLSVAGLVVGLAGLAMPRDSSPRPSDLWVVTSVQGVEAEHYESLDGMARAADAVVLGRLRSIDPGPAYGEERARAYFASIKLEVDEVLRGKLKADWVLHHPMGESDRTGELRKYISEDQAIYFLRDLEQEILDLGFSRARANDVAGAYRLVTNGAVINDDHGTAVLPLPEEGALQSVNGRDFDRVVGDIRGL